MIWGRSDLNTSFASLSKRDGLLLKQTTLGGYTINVIHNITYNRYRILMVVIIIIRMTVVMYIVIYIYIYNIYIYIYTYIHT